MDELTKVPLAEPVEVASLTGPQAAELRFRNELLKRQEQVANDASVLLRIAAAERVNYIRRCVMECGLSLDSEYTVDEDGKVWLTAMAAPLDAPVAEPVPLNRAQRRSRKKAAS